jgi:hypothetical protein
VLSTDSPWPLVTHIHKNTHLQRQTQQDLQFLFGRGYSPLPTALAPVSGTVETISSGSGGARVGMQNYCHTLSLVRFHNNSHVFTLIW